MTPLRLGIIGTNFISDRLAEAAALTDSVRITAVISRQQKTADTFAARHGIPHAYGDFTAALASGTFDALYVATPNYTHRDITLAALGAGYHVLCEKIIADSTADFLAMRQAAERAGLVLLEAMRPDFDPAVSALEAALPFVGRLRRVSLEYCQYSSRYGAFLRGEVLPAFDPSIGNSALADIGIYPLHLAVRLFGAPADVHAADIRLDNGFSGMGTLTMTYPGGDKLVSVTYSKITESVSPSVFEGENGSLTLDKINAPTEIRLLRRGAGPQTVYAGNPGNNMIYELDAFAAMVRGELSPAPYLDVTEATMRVYDACAPCRNVENK